MLSDLALEIVGDTAIVWLLSPKAAFGARPTGGLARFTASLPGYCLQVSPRCGMLHVHASVPDVKHSHTSTTQACEVHSDLGLGRNTSARRCARQCLSPGPRTCQGEHLHLSFAQVGDFPAYKRVLTFVYRGVQFLAVGFGASVVGHGITKYCVSTPETLTPEVWADPLRDLGLDLWPLCRAAAALAAAQCHCWLPVALAAAGGVEQLAGLPATDQG